MHSSCGCLQQASTAANWKAPSVTAWMKMQSIHNKQRWCITRTRQHTAGHQNISNGSAFRAFRDISTPSQLIYQPQVDSIVNGNYYTKYTYYMSIMLEQVEYRTHLAPVTRYALYFSLLRTHAHYEYEYDPTLPYPTGAGCFCCPMA